MGYAGMLWCGRLLDSQQEICKHLTSWKSVRLLGPLTAILLACIQGEGRGKVRVRIQCVPHYWDPPPPVCSLPPSLPASLPEQSTNAPPPPYMDEQSIRRIWCTWSCWPSLPAAPSSKIPAQFSCKIWCCHPLIGVGCKCVTVEESVLSSAGLFHSTSDSSGK